MILQNIVRNCDIQVGLILKNWNPLVFGGMVEMFRGKTYPGLQSVNYGKAQYTTG